MCLAVADFVYSGFQELFSVLMASPNDIGRVHALPRFETSTVVALCQLAGLTFRDLPIVLRLFTPINVVGDIHGNFRDLIRIVQTVGLDSKFVFLGDFVDRGPFSLECVLLLFALSVKYPDRFLLIRGNHEFADVASTYGFRDEVSSIYDESVFEQFMVAFSYLPLAATIDGAIFCVHGGIGRTLNRISQIESIERPITDLTDLPMVRAMLWADPTIEYGRFHDSLRASVQEFGPVALHEFLKANGFKLLLRGHQVVDGVHKFDGMDLITVFSSSNGDLPRPNRAAFLQIQADLNPRVSYFDPLPKIGREEAVFEPTGPHSPTAAKDRDRDRRRRRTLLSPSASMVALASGVFTKSQGVRRSLRGLASTPTFHGIDEIPSSAQIIGHSSEYD
jgi:diadenosine tetraphosphatase ApaH/serine/threonine PP2A family protein phosphatase